MPIDLESERIIPLRDGPKYTPGRPHLSAFYRWMQRPENPLETVLVGGRRFTSVEAIARFIRACNPSGATPDPIDVRREREIAAAEARLDKAGVR